MGVCIGAFLNIEETFNHTIREVIRTGAEEHVLSRAFIWWIMTELVDGIPSRQGCQDEDNVLGGSHKEEYSSRI